MLWKNVREPIDEVRYLSIKTVNQRMMALEPQ
jgi:hypothetical protein